MASKDIEWFKARIEEYPDSKSHNEDLKTFLAEFKLLSRETRSIFSQQLDFEPMFNLVLKWNNPVYADPFFELLELIFEAMKATEIVSKFESYLMKFIDHVSRDFQDLVFKVLSRVVDDGELETLTLHSALTLAASRVLADHSLDTATPCLKFLTKLAHQMPHGTRIVFKGEIGEVLKHYVSLDKVLSFRIYELVTSVACTSPEGLSLMQESGMLQDLFDSMFGPTAHVDQLGFANTVETYRQLSVEPHCYDFLVKSGVIAKLEDRIVEYGPGTMEDKVMPTLYEFFGDIFARDPERIAVDAPNVVPTVLKLAMVPIDRIHITRAEMIFIGQVATLPAGKLYLTRFKDLLQPVLELANEFVRSGAADNKTTAIDFTEALIFMKKCDQTPELLDLTESWFSVTMKSAKFVWDFAIEPYPNIARTSIQVFVSETIRCREHAFKLMAVMSTLPWGRKAIVDTPGLLEWLMDRYAACGVHVKTGSGGDPEVLRAKYAVVKNLSEHVDVNIAPELRDKMTTYIAQGPLYVQGEYEVALEAPQ